MTGFPRSIEAAKAEARALRAALAAQGRETTHSAALETVARAHGFHDWNTLHAQLGNRLQPPAMPGDRVAGRYLKQPFVAEVLGVTELSPGRYALVLHFDTPVDVVTFDSFSLFRRRVRAVVGPDGVSFSTTSDGVPHLVLDM
ncbi:glyoxalase superfamily protein [Ruixingdingia sedimenti]|uniref:Glyoxalase superfamily protein n=1 Tax=Ruixingdingia sedimenti TaxID=3073604 RepID=A0ABU1F6B2_9RHOB|nr:glyoxalase superfamily protein [Xinfangfangia sp. LG-4]MDR5652401.1 glyoxalase superfamily protein [Xinfangfangia sp. LG-4]